MNAYRARITGSLLIATLCAAALAVWVLAPRDALAETTSADGNPASWHAVSLTDDSATHPTRLPVPSDATRTVGVGNADWYLVVPPKDPHAQPDFALLTLVSAGPLDVTYSAADAHSLANPVNTANVPRTTLLEFDTSLPLHVAGGPLLRISTRSLTPVPYRLEIQSDDATESPFLYESPREATEEFLFDVAIGDARELASNTGRVLTPDELISLRTRLFGRAAEFTQDTGVDIHPDSPSDAEAAKTVQHVVATADAVASDATHTWGFVVTTRRTGNSWVVVDARVDTSRTAAQVQAVLTADFNSAQTQNRNETATNIAWAVVIVLIVLFGPMVWTVVAELVVAALFQFDRQGLLAVIFVNLITNPLLNAALLTLYGIAPSARADAAYNGAGPSYALSPWVLAAVIALEVAVVVVEWQLYVRALRGRAGSSRKLLWFAIVANAVSAAPGLSLLVAMTRR